MIPPRFFIDPLTAVVLLHHVVTCDDADNDADRTVPEIANELNSYKMSISKSLMESALYCCNMENELGKFWHPWKWPFDRFVSNCLRNQDLHFDRYYNNIYEKKKKKETTKRASLDSNSPGSDARRGET